MLDFIFGAISFIVKLIFPALIIHVIATTHRYKNYHFVYKEKAVHKSFTDCMMYYEVATWMFVITGAFCLLIDIMYYLGLTNLGVVRYFTIHEPSTVASYIRNSFEEHPFLTVIYIIYFVAAAICVAGPEGSETFIAKDKLEKME